MHTKSELSEALINFDQLPNSANVRLPIVMALYGISPATVWRNVKIGNIPKPNKLTARTTVWNVGELRVALNVKGA
ncbi:AlpA Predicted transcriptional regulator [Methylophilaceae bacterium]